MKKIFYIILLISFSKQISGQTFKNDWLTFKNINWELVFTEVPKQSFNSKITKGQLIFKNKKDKSIELIYDVLLKSDIDDAFNSKVHDHNIVQSCATATKNGKTFISFNFKLYYYLLSPCHRCSTAWNEDCAELSDQLTVYILTK